MTKQIRTIGKLWNATLNGFWAGERDKPRESNPYKREDYRKAWREGWVQGQHRRRIDASPVSARSTG